MLLVVLGKSKITTGIEGWAEDVFGLLGKTVFEGGF